MRPLRLSRIQLTFLVLGIVLTVLFAAVAIPNLSAIYEAEEDFTIGLILGAIVFCFSQVFSRARQQVTEEMAEELIRRGENERIRSILRDEIQQELHDTGVHRQLSLLQRNVSAAFDRLSDFYDEQSGVLDFARHRSLLEVVLDDLDKVYGNLNEINGKVQFSGPSPAPGLLQNRIEGNPTARIQLVAVRRELREAINRRNQTYDSASSEHPGIFAEGSEARDIFSVMTADLLKGTRLLEELLSTNRPIPDPDAQLLRVTEYLSAAHERADQFLVELEQRSLEVPQIFEVMREDVASAQNRLINVRDDLSIDAAERQSGTQEESQGTV